MLKSDDEKLSEVILLFKIRLKRLITPLGKVAVLKSLILSKLVHGSYCQIHRMTL